MEALVSRMGFRFYRKNMTKEYFITRVSQKEKLMHQQQATLLANVLIQANNKINVERVRLFLQHFPLINQPSVISYANQQNYLNQPSSIEEKMDSLPIILKLLETDYFYGFIESSHIEKILNKTPGSFLIRFSVSSIGSFAVSVRQTNGNISNYLLEIMPDKQSYLIYEKKFTNVFQFVDTYSRSLIEGSDALLLFPNKSLDFNTNTPTPPTSSPSTSNNINNNNKAITFQNHEMTAFIEEKSDNNNDDDDISGDNMNSSMKEDNNEKHQFFSQFWYATSKFDFEFGRRYEIRSEKRTFLDISLLCSSYFSFLQFKLKRSLHLLMLKWKDGFGIVFDRGSTVAFIHIHSSTPSSSSLVIKVKNNNHNSDNNNSTNIPLHTNNNNNNAMNDTAIIKMIMLENYFLEYLDITCYRKSKELMRIKRFILFSHHHQSRNQNSIIELPYSSTFKEWQNGIPQSQDGWFKLIENKKIFIDPKLLFPEFVDQRLFFRYSFFDNNINNQNEGEENEESSSSLFKRKLGEGGFAEVFELSKNKIDLHRLNSDHNIGNEDDNNNQKLLLQNISEKYDRTESPIGKIFRVSETDFDILSIRWEILTLAYLDHPNIVSFIGYRTNPLILMMEPMIGDLFNIVQNNPNIVSTEFLIRCCHDVTKGMAFMHGMNVVHGDFSSPRNVLLASIDPSAKIVAKISDLGESSYLYPSSSYRSVLFGNDIVPYFSDVEIEKMKKNDVQQCSSSVYQFLSQYCADIPDFIREIISLSDVGSVSFNDILLLFDQNLN